ncbi:MAG TPA: VTT domain-containing protein, partial [Solirubrobacteraceae bacterium]
AAAAIAALPHDPAGLRALVAGAGAAAPVAALAAWVVLTPALFPGTVLAAACGLAFGAATGSALAWAGSTLGALAAFAVARHAARAPAERALGDRGARVRAAIDRHGFTAVLAARLAPGVPATGLNYVAGLTRVRARDFAAAIALAAVPRTAPYALLGAGLAGGSPVALAVTVGAAGALGAGGALLAWRLGVSRRAAAPPP